MLRLKKAILKVLSGFFSVSLLAAVRTSFALMYSDLASDVTRYSVCVIHGKVIKH